MGVRLAIKDGRDLWGDHPNNVGALMGRESFLAVGETTAEFNGYGRVTAGFPYVKVRNVKHCAEKGNSGGGRRESGGDGTEECREAGR